MGQTWDKFKVYLVYNNSMDIWQNAPQGLTKGVAARRHLGN